MCMIHIISARTGVNGWRAGTGGPAGACPPPGTGRTTGAITIGQNYVFQLATGLQPAAETPIVMPKAWLSPGAITTAPVFSAKSPVKPSLSAMPCQGSMQT